MFVFTPLTSFGQHSTGNIEGTVYDASGAVLPNAQVTVTDESTGVVRKLTTDTTGLFRAIELQPGNYSIEVSAGGFNNARINHLVVRFGVLTPVDIKMQVGRVQQVTEVSASEIAVDTTSTQVEGVVNQQQIEQLAIIGRNVADLAQVQPGVQIRDGGDIDPTKNNFSIISIEGRGGRETQMQWDGLSVEDYSVGGSVVNISLDGIQEFQVAQATLDPSQSVATGGAVNIISRRGSNSYHGSAYEFFRSDSIGAAIGGIKAPFERNQFGGRFGGPIVLLNRSELLERQFYTWVYRLELAHKLWKSRCRRAKKSNRQLPDRALCEARLAVSTANSACAGVRTASA